MKWNAPEDSQITGNVRIEKQQLKKDNSNVIHYIEFNPKPNIYDISIV